MLMRFAIVFALLCGAARAAEPPPKTMQMPTAALDDVVRYLAGRPWAEVHQILDRLGACAALQTHSDRIIDTGACPEVSEALHQKAPPATPAAP